MALTKEQWQQAVWRDTKLSITYTKQGCPRVGSSGGTAQRVLKHLYEDAFIYLPRKYERVMGTQ